MVEKAVTPALKTNRYANTILTAIFSLMAWTLYTVHSIDKDIGGVQIEKTQMLERISNAEGKLGVIERWMNHHAGRTEPLFEDLYRIRDDVEILKERVRTGALPDTFNTQLTDMENRVNELLSRRLPINQH